MEVSTLASGHFRILSLEEIGCFDEIPETGNTIEENAFQKASFIFRKYKVDCFADDTGLEIEALEGRPGVYAARYAGEPCSFEDNMNKVLFEMQGKTNRKAVFRTVISLLLNGQEHLFEGRVEGHILEKKRGIQGFGYDPIFIPEGYKTSFAEMDIYTKNRISHRGLAVSKLVTFLLTFQG